VRSSSSASSEAARLNVGTITETSMSISAVAQPFAELSTEVAQLSFGGDPFSAIAADERLQPLARIARGAAEQEAGHAADRCHLPEIQTELRDRMDRLHARARNPFPYHHRRR